MNLMQSFYGTNTQHRYAYGRVLILDGVIQCSLKDEFTYQEAISFLPLCCHLNPENVLICGGGDGGSSFESISITFTLIKFFLGVAREVVKHPDVKVVHQVEIDGRVVELSKKYLPSMACGFDSPKLTLTIGDGFEFIKKHEGEYDVIITDCSDPIGPGECLFEENYFAQLKKALKPNGVICSQAGNYWTDIDRIKSTMAQCRKHFPTVGFANISVPTYSGDIGFIIASTTTNHHLKVPRKVFNDEQLDAMNLKFYSHETHRAVFEGIPRSVIKQLQE